MQRWLKILFLTLFLFPHLGIQQAMAIEPAMADYTHYPIFQLNAVEPNILIILDNSGSMNFNAYGTWPGNGGIVTDAPFLGEPYRGVDTITVSQASDDAEQSDNYTYDDLNDLDLSPSYTVGIRFTNLSIPKGALILSAHITFKCSAPMNGNNTSETTVTFHGQASDNASTFGMNTYDNNISSRPSTTASVRWDITNPWTTGLTYQSPDVSPIIQEIVNRGGWSSGNAIALKVTSTNGYREVDPFPDGPTLHVRYLPQPFSRYYGYFNPDYFYYWNVNRFDHKYKKIAYVGDPSAGGYWSVTDLSGNPRNLQDNEIVSAGLWDGNWLNWVSMRRVDVLRKVLMGGLATSRTGGGNQTNFGETPPVSTEGGREFIKRFNSSVGSAVSPYDGDYYYGMKGGYIYVHTNSNPFSGAIAQYGIAIQKNILYDPQDFYSYDSGNNLAGVLQKVGNKARWGNEWFNYGTGSGKSGGFISNTIGSNLVDLVNDIQNTKCDSWTPLAEAYYVATQYFKQQNVQTGLDYPNNVIPLANVGQDPFYVDGAYVHCADSFVILLTDGASTKDGMIPDTIDGVSLKDYDADGRDNTSCNESTGVNCDYPDGGTDYLDDIALYARTRDLRPNLPGNQNMVLYTIYAFGSEDNARTLLSSTAKNGGFDDRNGNNIPDLEDEWDKDRDGNPDTFFEANDGYKLEAQLIRTINEILARAASGTAVSVLSTTGEGEGNIYQAYFRPVVPIGLTEEVNWVGYVQSLWVDTFGNLREDTVNDAFLNVQEDRIISYFLNPATGDTGVKRFAVSAANPYPNVLTEPYETVKLEEVIPLWEAGKRLSERNPDSTTFKRNLFTYLDKDKDRMVDESTYNPWDSDGEAVEFSLASAPAIKPYLGLKDDLMWSYLGTTHDQRVSNLISYIRGNEILDPPLRSRTLDGKVWRLGDIVYSTPTPISTPPDNYHLIYSDQSYREFFEAQKSRETVVYLGANDGMLHAFTSWQRNATTGQYERPLGAPAQERIGDEIWAYIPQSLLPHLKWLPSLNYTHVDYVDLKPKIFDAKIDHDNNPGTSKEWRTLLVAGLNMGGKYIWAEGAFDNGSGVTATEIRNFYPSYTCMDITDPRNPRLLWERSYTDLELTTSIPTAIKVKDKWFLVFGSGPTAYDGTSTKNGHVFIVDIETGNPYRNGTNDWLFQTGEANAFMNSPVSLDKNLDFNVDAVYFGETYLSGGWKGKIHKVTVPSVDGLGNYDVSSADNYIDNPLNPARPWMLSSVFNALKPITAPVSLSIDPFDNAWIFVGSGRYLSTLDKTDTDAQYIFGIKDPFYNKDHTPGGLYHTNYYHNYSSSLELRLSDLFAAGPYIVISGGQEVFNTSGALVGSFNDILDLARLKNGWFRALTDSGERVLNKSTLLGGIVLTPSFVPDGDVCAFGGDSYLYGLYYETGTPYSREVFVDGTDIENIGGQVYTKILARIGLGAGKASAVGIHVGRDGAKSLVQQSTGAIVTEAVTPAFTFTSGMRSWIQK